jgi:hypothetical protein
MANAGKDGARGPRGAQGAPGKVGAPGAPGKNGAPGTAAKVEGLGICYSTTSGSGSVYYLSGVYISPPQKHPDGTTYCADGTYVPVEPQSDAAPPGD